MPSLLNCYHVMALGEKRRTPRKCSHDRGQAAVAAQRSMAAAFSATMNVGAAVLVEGIVGKIDA